MVCPHEHCGHCRLLATAFLIFSWFPLGIWYTGRGGVPKSLTEKLQSSQYAADDIQTLKIKNAQHCILFPG